MNSTPTEATNQPDNSCSYVLVVDDDEAVLAMTKAILESVGFTPIGAASGELGLHYYQQGVSNQTPFLLVLLDLTLPGGMSGLETLDAILEFDPKARVIATSGYFDDTAVVAQGAKQRGFVGILPKPYTAERLLKLVQWGIEREAA